MKEFKKLTPFKLQVLENFPFIDEDFDAITNYELLCKVVEYLNKTNINVDSLSNKVDTLNNKVVEFQNYFDNLDVQEEINNKLDEMAESGELAEIINNYLNINITVAFPTYNSNGEEITGQDVQGDCTIIKSLTKNVVIDTMKTSENFSSIQTTMNKLNINKIDYFIITHYHYDHYNNLENFINTYDVSNCLFIIPRLPSNLTMRTEAETGYNYVINLLESNNLTYIICDNQTIEFDNVTMKLMNGSQEDYDYIDNIGTLDYNDYSLCVEFIYKEKKILITGDIANIGQHNVIPNMSGNYDIMKDCHHGLSNYDLEFARLCTPKNLVVPVTKAMWSYNQAKFGAGLLSYFMTETSDIFLLGYQNEDIIYNVNNNGVNLLTNNFTYNNLKLAIRGTTTLYVNSSSTQLKRDGSITYPYTSLKECLSLINKNNNRNYVIEVQANETINERYIVYGLRNTIINFNNYISGAITFENCENITLNDINIINRLTNDNVGDLYVRNCKNIDINNTATFDYESKTGIEVLNTNHLRLAGAISIKNKDGAFVFGNSKIILEINSINFENVNGCIWCYNSQIIGNESVGNYFRTAFDSGKPVITGTNQKRCIISKGFKNAINTIFSGDVSSDAISFPYSVLEFDKIEVHYNNGGNDLSIKEIPIKNVERTHDLTICYPNSDLDKLFVTTAQLYGGPAGTYLSISRNTNIVLPDGTVGTSKIHITKLILK